VPPHKNRAKNKFWAIFAKRALEEKKQEKGIDQHFA